MTTTDRAVTAARKLSELGASLVQTAVTFDSTASATNRGEIRLHGVSPATLYVAQRPDHEVGYIATPDLVALWPKGDHSYASAPPNAVVTFLGTDDISPEHAVITLSEPTLDGETLTYAVKVLEGHLPAESGACVVIIEP